jgi:hypothetical protein
MIRPTPRLTARSLAMIAPLCLALVGTPAAAQIRGAVVDQSERPVAGALVELWSNSQRTAGAQADNQGRFEIPSGPAELPLILTVRRLGLVTQTVQLGSRDTTLRITMDVQPVTLRPVTVEASAGRLCPRADEAQARQLWDQMRRRYWQPGRDSVFVLGFLETRSGIGEKRDVFDPRTGRARTGWTTGGLVEAHPELMALSGYALSASGGAGDRTAFWDYRALDDGSMQDFTGAYFGSAHTFSIVSQGPEQTILAFCPRERLRGTGQVQGTLVLRPDTTLSLARWAFQTPNPREDAGGEASYFLPDPALGRALLARETAFWRKSGRKYYFEAKAFTGWRRWFVGPAGEPVLP